MGLSVVTVVFLLVAVVVALGILAVVAAPHLRVRDDEDEDSATPERDRRHSSRTRR